MMEHDFVIIGAGPAGLNMARAASEKGADYEVIEKDTVGGAWNRLYENMEMISPATPQVDWTSLPGLEIWRMGSRRPFPTRNDFLGYLDAYKRDFKLNVREGVEVVSVSRKDKGGFSISLSDGSSVSCIKLIVATGIISNPYVPENLRDRPNVIHSLDFRNPVDFDGKRVIVAGGGNSAAETVIKLAGWASELTMAHPGALKFHRTTRQPEHIRGSSESLLTELLNFGLVNHMPESIVEDYDGKRARISGKYIEADVLIAATGFRPHLGFLNGGNLNIKMKGHFPAVSMRLESVSEPGVFFTGSLTNVFPYSNFIHGFREDAAGMDFKLD